MDLNYTVISGILMTAFCLDSIIESNYLYINLILMASFEYCILMGWTKKEPEDNTVIYRPLSIAHIANTIAICITVCSLPPFFLILFFVLFFLSLRHCFTSGRTSVFQCI